MATNRHVNRSDVIAALEASPQFAEDARARHLVDRIGYDDEADSAAQSRAGTGAKLTKFTDYVKSITHIGTRQCRRWSRRRAKSATARRTIRC